MKKRTVNIISIVIFILAITMLTLISIPLIKSYNNPARFESYIESLGSWGLIMMFFIQIAQIIVAFIPGEVIEFVAGTLYGWFGGLIFCCIGIAVGQSLVFNAVKFFGRDFVEKAAGSKTMAKFKFLQNERKLKFVIFFLFFIPGTPKDLITYIVPLTKIKLSDFLIVTFLARIPSVISSTFAGDAFAQKNYLLLIAVYAGIFIFTMIGVFVYRFLDAKFLSKHHKKAG